MPLDLTILRGRFLPLAGCCAPLVLLAATLGAAAGEPAAAERTGETIFKTTCAACHGPQGEGTKKHKERLEGDKSLAQLVDLIGNTMPDNDPGSLSQHDTDAVAEFVYNAMYSPTARDRNRPARIELARLTVRQYRHAVADLIGSFRSSPAWGAERGLKAEYFQGREFRDEARKINRVDPEVNFDFGFESPDEDNLDPQQFSIRWNGSLLAEETGVYDFVVYTDQAARLWVNDDRHPLIDAWVKSGKDMEHKASLFLVGGRMYPVRLEFSKSTQGVKDKKNKKKIDDDKPPVLTKASIALKWKRPSGAEEPIPSRQLGTVAAAELFTCATPFPPDDRSYGWERGTTVSKEWDEATTEAAIETADYVAAHLNDLAGTKDDAKDRSDKLRAFCLALAERAFRRPLSDDELKAIVDKHFADAIDADAAVKRVVLRVLTSPRFLYRELGGQGDGYDVASRLSFGLWDSLPDQELLKEAKAGRLVERDEVARQAERMLGDVRARAKLHEFMLTWLKADQPRDLTKDLKKFPGFDATTIADLRTSLEIFLDEVTWSDKSDFRELLSADYLYMNGRLAKFYGVDLPTDAGFSKVKLDADRRAGVLTHPYLMAGFAHNTETSPILRGVFLARGVLALSLRPPPEAKIPLSPELQPTLTTRERVTLQTQASTCMSCHAIINPLGFTLEHFDAVGRYREQDNDKPIDSTGVYHSRSGKIVTIQNARELGDFLAGSDEAQTAFVEQMFHNLVQQPVRAYGPTALDDLHRSFVESGFNIRKLAVATMVASVFKPGSGPTLEKEQARQALIEWVKSEHDAVLDLSLDFLRKEPIEDAGHGIVKIGKYSIDLEQRTFIVIAASDTYFAEYEGEFVFDKQSKTWKVTGVKVTQT